MLRRVVLIAALAVLVFPAAAWADSIDFSFQGGSIGLSGGAITGTSTLIGVCDPSQTCPNILGNLGTVSFTTGVWNNVNGFAPGGSLTIASNASFPTIGAATLFSGSFTGTTAWFQSGVNQWTLSGAISGNTLSALYNLLGIIDVNPANGALIALVINFDEQGGTISSGNINVSPVPEPGTLALFGTGLIGLAGALRRRLKA